jgi:hypothetical protein
MCCKPGQVISDCFQLPGEVRVQAAHNRALYYKTSPTPQVDLKGIPTTGPGTTPIARKSYRAAVVVSPPSEVSVIEEDPPNLPAARDSVERTIVMETDKVDSEKRQGGM